MQLACKCLNVIIVAKGILIEKYDLFAKDTSSLDHPFFRENIGCVELESIHKEQSLLVEVESCGEWLIHRCLNCCLLTHALDTASTAVILVNRALLGKSEITVLQNSEKYSPAFHIIVDSEEDDATQPEFGMRGTGVGLHTQLTEWLRRETAQTEERVRQFSEQQYAALELKRSRTHKDHAVLTRILRSVKPAAKSADAAHFTSVGSVKPLVSPTHHTQLPVLPDPAAAIAPSRKPVQVTNRPKNLARKPSVDAEGLFDLEGMDETPDTIPSDEELSDTDDSGSHDEGIHIPRHVNASTSLYAKSLPVNVPVFPHLLASGEDPHHEHRPTKDQVDIAASIKALAKSVHGDAVFGDLPRPRFSSQI